MKIAVTYEDGNVFPHFGRTEQFKLYDIQAGKVADARVVSTDGNTSWTARSTRRPG